MQRKKIYFLAVGRILKLSIQCLYGEGNETQKYRLDLSARTEFTATKVLPGKKTEREIT